MTSLSPPVGEDGIKGSTKTKNQRLGSPLRGLHPIARGVGVVVEGACFLVVLIGRFGPRGTGLVGMLNEVSAAVEHEFGPPAVQCKSQAPPDLLEKGGLARPVAHVEELEMPSG